MKKNSIILFTISILLFIITGCPEIIDVGPVTIETRIARFEDDLNNTDRSDVYTNFHTDTASYDQIKDSEYFEGTPLASAYIPFDFSLTTTPDNDAEGQQTIYANMYREDPPVLAGSCTFLMQKDGDIWYIRQFTFSAFTITKTMVID